MNDEYWKQNYNTKLSPENEAKFNRWVAAQSKLRGRDMSNDDTDYDLRGYWLNGGHKDQGQGHMPDTYKKPNHPTFSNESIYHGAPDPRGGKFDGGKWGGNDETGWTFMPSHHMLSNIHKIGDMKRYFSEQEQGARLVLPIPYL